MQVAKARYFVTEYGRGPFVMGTARLQPIGQPGAALSKPGCGSCL